MQLWLELAANYAACRAVTSPPKNLRHYMVRYTLVDRAMKITGDTAAWLQHRFEACCGRSARVQEAKCR